MKAKRWTEKERAELRRLWEMGVARKTIAIALGRTDASVIAKANAMRLGSRGKANHGGPRGPSAARSDRRRKNATSRICLCCRQPFASEGIHNRLCRSCKDRDGAPLFLLEGRP